MDTCSPLFINEAFIPLFTLIYFSEKIDAQKKSGLMVFPAFTSIIFLYPEPVIHFIQS